MFFVLLLNSQCTHQSTNTYILNIRADHIFDLILMEQHSKRKAYIYNQCYANQIDMRYHYSLKCDALTILRIVYFKTYMNLYILKIKYFLGRSTNPVQNECFQLCAGGACCLQNGNMYHVQMCYLQVFIKWEIKRLN